MFMKLYLHERWIYINLGDECIDKTEIRMNMRTCAVCHKAFKFNSSSQHRELQCKHEKM